MVELRKRDIKTLIGLVSEETNRDGGPFPVGSYSVQDCPTLSFDEHELFALADHLFPQTSAVVESSSGGQVDLYAAPFGYL